MTNHAIHHLNGFKRAGGKDYQLSHDDHHESVVSHQADDDH